MQDKTAIIIGAGPAGLTVAAELLNRTEYKPIIIEQADIVGGLSRTINYHGNRLDIGGHRFFSKSQRVIDWWLKYLPLSETNNAETDCSIEKVMLKCQRHSRIYYQQQLFNYPITLNWTTIRQLGLKETFIIGCSYLKTRLFPIAPENNLEDFFVNRFGRRLYEIFFKTYTEKVWGKPCQIIPASWGEQRVKGLSINKVIKQALRTKFKSTNDLLQTNTETSLIEQFLYPKYGPGQMWETVAEQIKNQGGKIILQNKVTGFTCQANKISTAFIQDQFGKIAEIKADLFFSTMPVDELVKAFGTIAPKQIAELAAGLQFRDFITVGLLVEKFPPFNDNWIYIHEPKVKLGRLQIFNNWSQALVADSKTVWLGLEYFCSVGDELWQMSDTNLINLAVKELIQLGLLETNAVIDSTVQKVTKAYPAYFGTYNQFKQIKKWTEQLNNLYLLGRNGMHHYNNQDHSMLSAFIAVDNIIAGIEDKANIWTINTEAVYHEEKT